MRRRRLHQQPLVRYGRSNLQVERDFGPDLGAGNQNEDDGARTRNLRRDRPETRGVSSRLLIVAEKELTISQAVKPLAKFYRLFQLFATKCLKQV